MLIYRMDSGLKMQLVQHVKCNMWWNMFEHNMSYYRLIRQPCILNFFLFKSLHITGISLYQSLVTPFLFQLIKQYPFSALLGLSIFEMIGLTKTPF